MYPRKIRILTIDGDTSGMTQEESESSLFESVLCCEIMDAVFPEYGVYYRAVKMACVIDYQYGRFMQLVSLLLLEPPGESPD